MTQPFVPGYGPAIPAPIPGVDVEDEGIPIPGPTQTINFVGAGVTAAPGAPGTVDVTIPGGGGAVTGFPDALLYENPTGTAPISDAALVAAPIDVFGRPQLWDYRVNAGNGAVFRQGQWVADGDPTNITGEGFVTYGPANGLQDAANGMFGRVKYDRFGLRRIVGGVDIGYAFRVDATEMYLKDDTAAVTFHVDRATGDTTVAGTVSAALVQSGGLDVATVPAPAQDTYAAYGNTGALDYTSSLRIIAGRPRFYSVNYPWEIDNSVGYAIMRFNPATAPAGAPYFGAGNGMLFVAQHGNPGSGLSGGDMGIQAGNSDTGALGGTAFVQPGSSVNPADNGFAELRNSAGSPRVQVGGATDGVGFHGTTPIAKPTVTGARGGNAALASLLTALASYGLIIDGTTP